MSAAIGDTLVMFGESPMETRVRSQDYMPLPQTRVPSGAIKNLEAHVPSGHNAMPAIYLGSAFRRKVEDKENQFQWVSGIIARDQPHWATSKGMIHRHDLKFEARMWLDLICARIIPSKNTTQVPIEVAILFSCIMD
ncbi:hypothetical protein HAX54_043663 [Datura stramonium]|uniref:Uncharacterized protein n=1 Tax=Datura stramonium TaxID=4076 RepID=A0ABS8W5J8_DATST|nr:hypothetical protein [Datura stramonium]